MSKRSRSAFTLVELLVVVAILAVLVGMLVPAVQKARETSSRAECVHHLKQIGVAIHAHYETKKFFPTGGATPWASVATSGGLPTDGRTQTLGWCFQILPYLEKGDVWRLPEPWYVPMPIYNCPSRRPPLRAPQADRYVGDYCAVTPSADGDIGGGVWRGDVWSVPTYARYPNVIARTLTVGAPVTMRQILDGTSNTLMCSEKRLAITRYTIGSSFDDCGWADGWDADTIRSGAPEPDSDPIGGYEVGSCHPAGVPGLFADGSIRTIRYGIDQTTFDRLANREDGRAPTDFEP